MFELLVNVLEFMVDYCESARLNRSWKCKIYTNDITGNLTSCRWYPEEDVKNRCVKWLNLPLTLKTNIWQPFFFFFIRLMA